VQGFIDQIVTAVDTVSSEMGLKAEK